MLFIGLSAALDELRVTPGGLDAIYLIFPLQTVASVAVLAYFWPEYQLRAPRSGFLAVAAGVVSFGLWIAPQALFRAPPRLSGFNPDLFAAQRAIYWTEVIIRLLRLIVVVPILEEIFWRGFLLRYLISENFDNVPFGTYRTSANVIVALAFMLEHSRPDWPAALATGLLYNMVAFRARSLSSCVLAHAITNALLGAFIMVTHQWGFW